MNKIDLIFIIIVIGVPVISFLYDRYRYSPARVASGGRFPDRPGVELIVYLSFFLSLINSLYIIRIIHYLLSSSKDKKISTTAIIISILVSSMLSSLSVGVMAISGLR